MRRAAKHPDRANSTVTSLFMIMSSLVMSYGCDGDPSQLMNSVGVSVSERSGEESEIKQVGDEIPEDDQIAEPAMISGSHLTTVVCEPESDQSILCRYTNENAGKLLQGFNRTVKVEIRDKDGNLLDQSLIQVEEQSEDSPWSVRIKVRESSLQDWNLAFAQSSVSGSSGSENTGAVPQVIRKVSRNELFAPPPPETLDVDPGLVSYEKDPAAGGTFFKLKFSLSQIAFTKIFTGSCEDLTPWLPYSSSESLDYSKINGKLWLKFKDQSGRVSDCLEKPVTLDFTAPEALSGLNIQTTFNGPSGSMSASWNTGTDTGSGISDYQVSVGLSAGTSEVAAWISTTGLPSFSAGNLPADLNRDYFLNIRAFDNEGNESEVTSQVFRYSYNPNTELGSSLALWLDATDISNTPPPPASNGEISTWFDKSSYGRHFTTTTSAGPVFVNDAISGKPGLRFGAEGPGGDQTNRMLRNDAIDIRQGNMKDLTSVSVFVRKRHSQNVLWVGTGNNFSKRINSTSDATIGSPVIDLHQYQYDSGSGDTWLHAVYNGSNVIYDAWTTFETDLNSNAGMAIGCLLYSWKDHPGAYFGDHYVGELILVNRILTDAEKQKMWHYLSQKWGISIN